MTTSGTTLNVHLIITDAVHGTLEQSVTFTGIAVTYSKALLKKITTTANGRI